MAPGMLDAVTHGVGVAVSPLVLIFVVLILMSPRAGPNGIAFLAGWLIGLAGLGAIIFAIGGLGKPGSAGRYVDAIKLAFGILLLAWSVRLWLQRNEKKEGGAGWMAAADTLNSVKSVGAGIFFSAIYPKNLILTAAVASILGAESDRDAAIGTYALFMVLASVTIAAPIILYLVLGEKIDPTLKRASAWLSAHNQTILFLLILVFGLKLSISGGIGLAGQ